MKLRIFTNAYNCRPFILAQHEWLQQLEVDWTWAIAEGPAAPVSDSCWRYRMPPGRSPDGTADVLDDLAARDTRVIVKHQDEWPGIAAMNNACLPDYPCLVMQMSSDEVWAPAAVKKAIELFETHPEKTVASVYCHLYFGPDILVDPSSPFGNENEQNFRVLWRFEPGMQYLSYEPPLMSGDHRHGFTRQEMLEQGIHFDHLQYFYRRQAVQKELYYGNAHFGLADMHRGITARWEALQARTDFPYPINEFNPWAPPATMGYRVAVHPFKPYFDRAYANEKPQ